MGNSRRDASREIASTRRDCCGVAFSVWPARLDYIPTANRAQPCHGIVHKSAELQEVVSSVPATLVPDSIPKGVIESVGQPKATSNYYIVICFRTYTRHLICGRFSLGLVLKRNHFVASSWVYSDGRPEPCDLRSAILFFTRSTYESATAANRAVRLARITTLIGPNVRQSVAL